MQALLTNLCFFLSLGFAALMFSCNPPATVDQPAANLDLTVTVIDTGSQPAIVAQFLLNGSLVQFGGNVSVTCNGVALVWNGLGYAGNVPVVPSGGTYTLVYTRNGSSTSMALIAPPHPTVTSPGSGATVARSTNLTITYVADGGSGIRGGAGDSSTGLGGNSEPDTGTYTGLNVSQLHAGPGSVNITRDFSPTVNGTGFKSAKGKISVNSAEVPVTWN